MNKDFIELFSGIGGMSHGSEKAGWNCVGYVEMDKFAHQSYEILHDPDKKLWSGYDVRNVSDDDIRNLRTKRGGVLPLLAGGFPCQSFSIAGKRAGFADVTRGTLFFEIVRFALILRPKYLFLENVDGLRSHDKGKTFETILGALDELGYDVEWQMHNSVTYVPQNRERIYIIGHLRGLSTRKVFPFGRENTKTIEVVGRLEGNHDQNSRVYGIGGVAPCLSTMQGGQQEPKVLVLGNVNPSGNGMNGQVFDSEGISPTLTTNKGEGNKILVNTNNNRLVIRKDNISTSINASYPNFPDNNGLGTGVMEPRAVLTPDRPEKRQNGRRFKEPGEPMFTLTAQDKHGVAFSIDMKSEKSSTRRGTLKRGYIGALDRDCNIAVMQGYRIRKLTVLECFRLQTYPDIWYVILKLFRHPEYIPQIDMNRNDITAQVLHTVKSNGLKEGVSDSQLYKMAGNGVTSDVAEDIGKRLLDIMLNG